MFWLMILLLCLFLFKNVAWKFACIALGYVTVEGFITEQSAQRLKNGG